MDANRSAVPCSLVFIKPVAADVHQSCIYTLATVSMKSIVQNLQVKADRVDFDCIDLTFWRF